VNGYTPRDPHTLGLIAILLIATLLFGLAITRLPPRGFARLLAWLLTIGMTVGVERLCLDEPAGIRMLAIIGALLFAMKAVVTIEAQAGGMPVLSAWQWLGFAAFWPGMRPGIFANAGRGRLPDAWHLVRRGLMRGGIGLVLAYLACVVWHHGHPFLSDDAACVLATILLLPGLSLILHFGIFNILAGLWRLAGVDARPLFRAPLAARSLSEFWSRRWNLAFSEMTSLGIYRPVSASMGRTTAIVAAFVASGLLHELAISVPVLAGFGLPTLYFMLHGVLVFVERGFEHAGRPVSSWGRWAHLWVVGWLAVPMPILFHRPFLRGIVWPLIGVD
jgi:Membrane bound O-acyl transferase family